MQRLRTYVSIKMFIIKGSRLLTNISVFTNESSCEKPHSESCGAQRLLAINNRNQQDNTNI